MENGGIWTRGRTSTESVSRWDGRLPGSALTPSSLCPCSPWAMRPAHPCHLCPLRRSVQATPLASGSHLRIGKGPPGLHRDILGALPTPPAEAPLSSAQGPELPPQHLTQRQRHGQADRDGQEGPEDHQAQPQLSHSLAGPEPPSGRRREGGRPPGGAAAGRGGVASERQPREEQEPPSCPPLAPLLAQSQG